MTIHRNKQPYKSTNIYRVTASLTPDFPELNPFEKLERARKIVFTFDYPTPDSIEADAFKQFFETMFISRFWERWLRQETFESFTIQLYGKMLEVMPVYAELLDLFFTENKEEIFLAKSKTDTTTKSSGSSEGSSSGKNENIASMFPANMATAGKNIGNVKYANNGALSSDNTENETSNEQSGETHTTTLSGSMLDSIIKFNREYKNIFNKLLNEFNGLFSYILF